MKTYKEAIESLKSEEKLNRIAIYRHEKTTNEKLYDNLYTILNKKNHVEIVDSFFLSSYEGLKKDTIDILVIPEVESLVPVQIYSIDDYLRWGGSLIIAGNDMLMQKKTPEDIVTLKQDSFNNVFGPEDVPLNYYRGTIGMLGIKPYVSDIDPVGIEFDTDFISNVPKGFIKHDLYRDGVKCNTTSNFRVPFPFSGCAFAERYEVLRNFDIVSGYDGMGQKINSAVTFSENWETGARLCVFPSISKNSFFDKGNAYHEPVINSAVEFCINKLVISYCMPQYVCYRHGEKPYIDYKVKSFYKTKEKFDIEIIVFSDGKEVFKKTDTHFAEASSETKGTVIWNNDNFENDIYEIRAKVIKNGKTSSKASNAFVVWNEEITQKGMELKNDDEYFNIGNNRSVVLGTNYYESNTNSHMWVMPNISKLNSDLKQMAEFGINFIRIHYHHPKWFYDFWKQRYNSVPKIYEDLGDCYLPTEKYLRIFDAHVYLCQKYKIIYGGDLFTLVPEEMGDPRGWFGTHDYCSLEEKINSQKEFLGLLIPRYKNVPGISWDIINEPHISSDIKQQEIFHKVLSAWEFKIKKYMIELGEKHPIAVGNDISGLRETGVYTGVADYLTPHANYKNTAKLKWDNYNGPQFLHEVWMDSPFTPEGDKKQLEYMKMALIDAFRTGLAGFAPWQWTEQLAMWQSTGTHPGENWDDMLGCCVRHDGTLKPSGRFYKDFIRLFGDLKLEKFNGNNKIKAKEGIITFKPIQYVKAGDYYFVLANKKCPIRGIAKSFCTGTDFSIKTTSDTAAVFFDFSKEGTVYIKADEVCKMKIKLPKKIKKVFITNGLDEVEVKTEKTDSIDLDIIPWQTNYWFKFAY